MKVVAVIKRQFKHFNVREEAHGDFLLEELVKDGPTRASPE